MTHRIERKSFVRGPQGSTKLTPEDSVLLESWTDKHGYDGTAKLLGVSPTLIQKLSHGGTASPRSVKHMSDVLRRAYGATGLAGQARKPNDPAFRGASPKKSK